MIDDANARRLGSFLDEVLGSCAFAVMLEVLVAGWRHRSRRLVAAAARCRAVGTARRRRIRRSMVHARVHMRGTIRGRTL
ncbi:MAG: hypothetical protein ABW033_04370 [Acidimicrobiia bacterium]